MFRETQPDEESFAPPPHWRKRPTIPPPLPAEVLMIVSVAGLVASSLYIAGVFTAALVWGNHGAAVLAILTAGSCYFAYFAQIARLPEMLCAALVGWSITIGICAGVWLIL